MVLEQIKNEKELVVGDYYLLIPKEKDELNRVYVNWWQGSFFNAMMGGFSHYNVYKLPFDFGNASKFAAAFSNSRVQIPE